MKNGQSAFKVCPWVAGLGVLALVGCGSAAGGPPESTDTDDSALVSRTLVTLGPDGSRTVSYETVPRSQQLAEFAARRNAKLDPSSRTRSLTQPNGDLPKELALGTASCDDPAITWIFSGPNLTGRQLCVMGAGAAHLDEFVYMCTDLETNPPSQTCSYWGGKVGSYWVGASGAFRKWHAPITWPDDAAAWVSFAYWDQVNSVAAPSYERIRLDY